jgi:hypothetical protein
MPGVVKICQVCQQTASLPTLAMIWSVAAPDIPFSTPSRHRCKSLVPQLYDGLSISHVGLKQEDFPGRALCSFLPQTIPSDPRDILSEQGLEVLKRRASRLRKNAVQNYRERVSEATWEADYRVDVFGRIRNDDRLRMYVLFSSQLLKFCQAEADNL